MARQATAARTQEERTEEAKSRLRAAALELFAAQGYDAVSLAAISLKAGFSRTLAQYHYPDKAALALELIEDRLRRDNQVELLGCPADASGEEAWAALMAHLDGVSRHYGSLHGGGGQNVAVRGEMAIHAAALMGSEPEITRRVDVLTRDLIKRVERLFEICRGDGTIPVASDAHALAVLHVHSIWGLALALFASPRAGRQIDAAMNQITVLLEALRGKR